MRKIEDYENKMVHNGKRNERFVLIPCNQCGKGVWKKWHSRIKRGDPQYCNKECFDDWQKEMSKRKFGKENAGFVWDKGGNRWCAYWFDDENKRHATTRARWLWEKHHGKVPDGYWVTYKDENPENCELENLVLISRGDRMSDVMMGHKHSEEAKRNMSKAHTGKVLSGEHKKNISKSIIERWKRGEFDTKEYRDAAADRVKGEKNPNWRGGATNNPYPDGWNRELKNKIRDRDGHKCQICSISGKVVHHIDADKNNLDLDNLITVCKRCHHNIHSTRKTDNIVISAFRSMLKY